MLREIDQLDGDNLLSAVPETLATTIAKRYTVSRLRLTTSVSALTSRRLASTLGCCLTGMCPTAATLCG